VPNDAYLDRLIDLALDEDLGSAGDVTTDALVHRDLRGRGELWAKEPMVLSGLSAFARVFQRFDDTVAIEFEAVDGDSTLALQRVARLEGSLRSLLICERTALNIIQRTSGISTLAAQAAKLVKNSDLQILDTRKTSPGMRSLSKVAVRDGGVSNHRFGLFDGVLIKDNHIAAVGGSVKEALRRARANAPQLLKIEIEVDSVNQLEDAITEGADIVLLDNFTDAQITEAVKRAKGRVLLEVSGGVTLERLPVLAKLGVNFVSMGALTHSARAMDLSLELITQKSGRSRGRGSG
jgi:nicotinate-nucleotide pyrophosphorylase (carboxylating)